MKIVDGAARVLGIVGDPIARVRAPEVWSALFHANGVMRPASRSTAAAACGCHVRSGTVMMDHQLVAMLTFLGFENGGYTPAAVRRA